MIRTFLITVIVLINSFNLISQNHIDINGKPLIIDILITPNKTVNIGNHVNIKPENISKHINEIINNHPFIENDKLAYRIFANKEMKLGDINDIQEYLLELHPARYERYLILDEMTNYLSDDPSWVKKINSLNFKKIN